MPSFSFGYTTAPIPPSEPHPEGRIVMRPWLAARVSTTGKAPFVDCTMCLDTGADDCVFPLPIAELIGLDVESMPKSETSGVAGKADICFANVRIEIPLPPGQGNSIVFETRAGFVQGLGIGLLGQVGFFDRFDVTFAQRQGIFTISH